MSFGLRRRFAAPRLNFSQRASDRGKIKLLEIEIVRLESKVGTSKKTRERVAKVVSEMKDKLMLANRQVAEVGATKRALHDTIDRRDEKIRNLARTIEGFEGSKRTLHKIINIRDQRISQLEGMIAGGDEGP